MNQTYVVKEKIDKYPPWKDKTLPLANLDIELTERCNNNCIHCCINRPFDDLNSKKKESSTGRIKELLKEAAALDCMVVKFTGGEPLLREDFEELYIFARRLGLEVRIFTNATLISPHLAKVFKRIPPLEIIEVTVYGIKKSTYEAATGTPGSFEAAIRGVNLLLENKILFAVKGVVLPFNKGELEEFEAWATRVSWMNDPPSYAMFFELRARRDEEKNRLIRKLRASPEEGLKFLTRRGDNYLKSMKKFCSKFIRPWGDKLFSCRAGINNACVDAYGMLQPCMQLRHPDCVYDLRKGSLKDALRNFFPGIRGMKAANPEYLRRCAGCFLKGLCEQCPAKSWMEHGTLDTPVEYLCEIAHTQARFLGLLQDHETAWEVTDWRERLKEFTGGNIYGEKSES